MILQNKAYAGEQLVYRAYYKNKIVWDHGDYANGVASGVLDGSAMPKPVDPTPIQLHTEATIDGTGKAHTMELISIQAHAKAVMAAEGNPSAAQTIRTIGMAGGELHAVGAPSAYSQVFSAAHGKGVIDCLAAPSAVGITFGTGVSDARLTAILCPTVAEFLNLLVSAGATIAGSATPQPQTPEQIIGRTEAELTAICATVAMPVHKVTFMCNGTELYSTKVVDGNACPDPVEAGEIGTPYQEMTAQYTFEHSGWTRTEGGDADADALTNITEDTVIYAAFKKSVRYYTISYYDDDGTYLTSESLAYGSIPSYAPTKDGYAFDDWYPDATPVTGDAQYYAAWVEKISFASADWATIAELSESGKASRHFAVGDEKAINYSYSTGSVITVVIAGFDHDDLADGSGKAGITCVLKEVTSPSSVWYGSTVAKLYANSTLHSHLNNTVFGYLPSELQGVIKTVNKKCDGQLERGYSPKIADVPAKLWALSETEIDGQTTTNMRSALGKEYEYTPVMKTVIPQNGWGFYTRSINRTESNSKAVYYYRSGSTVREGYSDAITTSRLLWFGFCV